MSAKYLQFLAFSAIVLLTSSFSSTPVNALSIDSKLQARHVHIGQAFAKRATNKRCKARSSSSAPAAGVHSTPAPSSSSVPYTPQPTTTTPKPAASTPAPAPAYSGGNAKAGLAFAVWDNNVPTILANFKLPHVSAIYSWNPNLVPGAKQDGYLDAPMLWGTKDLDQWKQLVVPGYASVVLGFNEPDHPNQAYLDPGYACQLWQQYMLPLRNQGYTLVSPATTSAPSGITWMHNFLNACGGISAIDKISVHWYGTKPQEFIQYLQLWYNTFGKPIWVTEFACQDFTGSGQTCGDIQGFARTVRGFMDSTWWVEKYFPFAISYNLGNVDGVNQLLGANLQPTELAHIYFD